MKIITSRFGEVQIDKNLAIHFSEGLLGFPDDKDYVIMDHSPGSPFCWLQSITSPDLAFVLTDPFLLKKDYLKELSKEEESLISGGSDEEILVFALVTVPNNKPDQATANLMGPLIIEPKSRTGRQVILANSGYSHQSSLFKDKCRTPLDKQ